MSQDAFRKYFGILKAVTSGAVMAGMVLIGTIAYQTKSEPEQALQLTDYLLGCFGIFAVAWVGMIVLIFRRFSATDSKR